MILSPKSDDEASPRRTATGGVVRPRGLAVAKPVRIVQIVTSIENEAAGTTVVVKRLAQSLATLGKEVELLSVGDAASADAGALRTRSFDAQFTKLAVVGPLKFSRGLSAALDIAASNGAVLHNHGLWRMPNLYPCWAAMRHNSRLICSTHGMLANTALKYSPVSKAVFSATLQRRALTAVSCFHVTSHQELEEIRAYGLDAPVAVIPNGVDIPALDPQSRSAFRGAIQRTMLYVGRLHPIKGLDRMLHAWARVEALHPDWRLRFVGPSDGGHGEELKGLAVSLGLKRVVFEEGLYGEAKHAAYREANIFVLPSLNENFGMVVAEALANGTPVISTKGAPWQGLVERSCGWWVDHGVEPLSATLVQAMAMPPAALRAMGLEGRAWMARDFSWARVAADMIDVYRWCASQGERPDTVIIDR